MGGGLRQARGVVVAQRPRPALRAERVLEPRDGAAVLRPRGRQQALTEGSLKVKNE